MLVVGVIVVIVGSNLITAHFGPIASPFVAFFGIGLEFVLRDALHEKWHGKNLKIKTLGLIFLGGIVTYILNHNAGMICVASVLAFSVALLVDAIVYEIVYRKPMLIKMNTSNVFSSLADSIIFPCVAFGHIMPLIIIGQFIAKVFGGFLWSIVIRRIKP